MSKKIEDIMAEVKIVEDDVRVPLIDVLNSVTDYQEIIDFLNQDIDELENDSVVVNVSVSAEIDLDFILDELSEDEMKLVIKYCKEKMR